MRRRSQGLAKWSHPRIAAPEIPPIDCDHANSKRPAACDPGPKVARPTSCHGRLQHFKRDWLTCEDPGSILGCTRQRRKLCYCTTRRRMSWVTRSMSDSQRFEKARHHVIRGNGGNELYQRLGFETARDRVEYRIGHLDIARHCVSE